MTAPSAEAGVPHWISANEAEKRVHRRLQAGDFRGLVTARFRYGDDVRLIDLSVGGALIETFGELNLNSNVVFELSGPASTILIPSRTLRVHSLSYVDDSGRREGAFAFRRPLQLTEFLKEPSAAWHKIVAHCHDGRILRGYTYDFKRAKQAVSISPSPLADAARQIPITELDSIFFIREGAAGATASIPVATQTSGRRVAVTVPDGGVVTGTAINHHRDSDGIFVQPADTSSIVRIFLTSRTSRNLSFL